MALYEVECPRCHATFPVAASDLAVRCPRCAMHLDLIAEEEAAGAPETQPTMEFERIEEPLFSVAPCPVCSKPLLLAPDDESGLCAHCEAPLAFEHGRAMPLAGSSVSEPAKARSFAPLVVCRNVPAAAPERAATRPPESARQAKKRAKRAASPPRGKNAAAAVSIVVCAEPLPAPVVDLIETPFPTTATLGFPVQGQAATPQSFVFPGPSLLPGLPDLFAPEGMALGGVLGLVMHAAGPAAPAPGVDVAAGDEEGGSFEGASADEAEPGAAPRAGRARKTTAVERKVDPGMPDGIPAALHGRKVNPARAAIEYCPECTHPFHVHPRDREAQCPHCMSYVAFEPDARATAAMRREHAAPVRSAEQQAGEGKPVKPRRGEMREGEAEPPDVREEAPARFPWRRGKKAEARSADVAAGAADEDLFAVEETVEVERAPLAGEQQPHDQEDSVFDLDFEEEPEALKAPVTPEPVIEDPPEPAPLAADDSVFDLDLEEEPEALKAPVTPEPVIEDPPEPAPLPSDDSVFDLEIEEESLPEPVRDVQPEPALPPAEDSSFDLDIEEAPAAPEALTAEPSRPAAETPVSPPAPEPLEEEEDATGIDLEPEERPERRPTPEPDAPAEPEAVAEPASLPERATPGPPAAAAELEPVADESELASLPSFEVVSEEPVDDSEGQEKRGLFARFGRRGKQAG